jgi:hypothetical protein
VAATQVAKAMPVVEKAAKASAERARPAVEWAKPMVAKSAERVLEAAQTSPNGKHRKANDPTNVKELRRLLDEAVATGKPIPYDKPLVTRLI